MNRYALFTFIFLTFPKGSVVAESSPDVYQDIYWADLRQKVEAELDAPHDSVMPIKCHDATYQNKEALRHFIRGCNLIGMFDPHDNMTSSGLSEEQMLKGIDRAISEFEQALKLSPKFKVAKNLLSYCKETKKSEYFKMRVLNKVGPANQRVKPTFPAAGASENAAYPHSLDRSNGRRAGERQ